MRAFIIVGIPIIGVMIAMGGGQTATRVSTVETKIIGIADTQDARTRDSEGFQTEVRSAITGLNNQLAELKDDVFATKVDVGVIKRLVTELRNQDVASAAVLPSNRHAWQPTPLALQ